MSHLEPLLQNDSVIHSVLLNDNLILLPLCSLNLGVYARPGPQLSTCKDC